MPVLACAVAKRGNTSTAKAARIARDPMSDFIVASPVGDDRMVFAREASSARGDQRLDRSTHLASSPALISPRSGSIIAHARYGVRASASGRLGPPSGCAGTSDDWRYKSPYTASLALIPSLTRAIEP